MVVINITIFPVLSFDSIKEDLNNTIKEVKNFRSWLCQIFAEIAAMEVDVGNPWSEIIPDIIIAYFKRRTLKD